MVDAPTESVTNSLRRHHAVSRDAAIEACERVGLSEARLHRLPAVTWAANSSGAIGSGPVLSSVPEMDALEQYLSERYWSEDDVLREVRADTAQRGPSIQVSPEAGHLLAVFVRALGATRVLEVGTLFGYSGIWMARELPAGGRLDTIEIEQLHAEAAEHWFERADLSDRVVVHRGAGIDVLETLPGPYDLAFVDANKDDCPQYTMLALERLRPGGMLIADNAIRGGRIVEGGVDTDIDGIRAMHDLLASDRSVIATTLPVGDGMAIAVKL